MAELKDLIIGGDLLIESTLDKDGDLPLKMSAGIAWEEQAVYINRDQAIELIKHISAVFDIK